MLKYRDLQAEIDAFFEPAVVVSKADRTTKAIVDVAKVGWARPSTLSLEEVQALCKELVLLDAKTDRAAA